MISYEVSATPNIVGQSSVRSDLTAVKSIPVASRSIFKLYADKDEIDAAEREEKRSALSENGYDPGIGNTSSPVASKPTAVQAEELPPDENPFIVKPESLLKSDDSSDEKELIFNKSLADILFADEKGTADTKGLLESSDEKLHVYGITDDDKSPAKKDVIVAHLKTNSVFYNNLLFNDDYLKAAAKAHDCIHLDYFYPSFKTHTFASRTVSAVGGLAYDTEFTKRFINRDDYDTNELADYIAVNYDASGNWYKVAYTDPEHIRYCCRMYLDVRLIMAAASSYANHGLDKWQLLVQDHYDRMLSAKEYSTEYFREAQALHDLMWDPLDDPSNKDVRASNAVSYLAQIKPTKDDRAIGNLSEANSGEMISKEDVVAWMKKELDPGTLEPYYLLPSKNQYLVLMPSSLSYAMDNIVRVDPADRKEYATNLNRLYHTFQPNIRIAADHPYAKYLNCGKFAIDPSAVVVPILEGVVEDDAFDKEIGRQLPQTYRIVELDYYNKAIEDLDPDHKKLKKGVDIS